MSNNLNLCLYSLPISWFDITGNLERIEKELDSLHPMTDILVLPETFITGFPSKTDKEQIIHILEDFSDEDVITKIKEWAKKYNIAITGSLIVSHDKHLFNRGFFIEPNGDEYFADKKHLFSLAGEDEIFTPGNKRMLVRFRGWNICVVICYDIRFPVWCRNRLNEYDLLISVANWPESRIGAWKKLLPARAIENESYVAGVNCCGTDSRGFCYDGSSMILDYKGECISTEFENFIYATLDQNKLLRFREKFPAWKDADNFLIL